MSEKNIDLVKAEIKRGVERHGNYNSSHEAYAVLLEEVDELWDEIKKRHQDYPAMKKEAIQVAAIAIRICDEIDEKHTPQGKERKMKLCPKCNNDDIATHYTPKGWDMFTQKDYDKECLYKVCRNCSYKWTEPCADAELD